MIREWHGLNNNQTTGQKILHEIGWQPVMVKRMVDSSENVGIDSEYTPEVITFEIKARIDPMGGKDFKENYIALVEDHIRPMMKVYDVWLIQAPDNTINEFKVLNITKDEIILEKQ